MIRSAGNPTRYRPSNFLIFMGLVFCAGGVLLGGVVLFNIGASWTERSYVPLQAQILNAEIIAGKSRQRGSYTIVTAEYAYQFNGRGHIGTQIGGEVSSKNDAIRVFNRLRAAKDTGTWVTAWVNPKRPQEAKLYRGLNWPQAVLTLPMSVFFLALGTGILTLRSPGENPAKGTLVAPDPGPYLLTAVLAIWTNLLAFPLAAVATADLVHGARAVHAVALAYLVAGFVLAALAWRLYEKRWLIGSPVLERLVEDAGAFTFRIHSEPALGLRTNADHTTFRVNVEISQVLTTKIVNKRKLQTVWKSDLSEQVIARGTASVDISVSAPEWHAMNPRDYPGQWRVTVRVLGNRFNYYLDPANRTR